MVRIFAALILACTLSVAWSQSGDSSIAHTLFLIGDAGEPYVKDNPIGKVLSKRMAAMPGRTTLLFLGDNVYPAGLPDKDSKTYGLAELSLQTQAGFVNGLDTRAIFIPGNHDWQHWGKNGLDYIRNQQRWIDSLKDQRITLLPQNGCPGPVQMALDEKTILVILDTQWFLHQWDKPVDGDLCSATTTEEVLLQVEDIFRSNPGKRLIVAAHHPLITYGEHGGVFTWKSHIFPLLEITEHLYIPMPVIGSIYPLYRSLLGHLQDTPHPLYKEFANALQEIMRAHPGSMYVAGHEHALQYIVKDSTYFVVSGSGSKTEFVRKKKHAVYAKDVRGFAEIALRGNGTAVIRFIQVDENFREGKEVFTSTIPAVRDRPTNAMSESDFSGKTVRVKASDQYHAGRFKERMLGTNYRAEWAQEVEVPVFDIGTERGGLKVLQRGGGQQTLSLRLADSSGHEYVLRSVEKFPEAAIPEMLRETFAQDLVQDQISASHPYAALVVAPMADAIGLYHTNPRLVYIPDDARLGEYRTTFANTLALFEERPDGDWSEAPYFGSSQKIISTRKVLEKLADDNDNSVDEIFVLKSRLFDLIIGDWDRHDDQWRWATFKEKKNDIYRPIPRDRDQAFFVNEGALAKIWSRRWALPKFEGFDEELDWPSGFSFNARHFDRTFLTRLSREEWVNAANRIKQDLTDEIIEASIRQWPDEIFRIHGEEIISNLKRRRDNIVSYAIAHYEFLSREVEITGSDKMELFSLERLSDGDLHVEVHKINKKGDREQKLFDRTFREGETKEVRLYGLDGQDRFEIKGSSTKGIKVRVIGGPGEDVLVDESRVRGPGKHTWFYDQTGHGKFQSAGEVKDLRSADETVNEYDRTSFEFDRLAPLVWGQFNPDDGVFLGAGFLFVKQGFRKVPFKQRHLFLASIAPETQSYNFRYQGKFTQVIAKWNLELDADLKSPNYVNNFFGMGNESVFNDEIDDVPGVGVDEAIQYYRYRFEELALFASISHPLGGWGNVQFGPYFQRIEMERPRADQDRFIEEYASTLPLDLFSEYNSFGGLGWQLSGGRRDNPLFTQRGGVWSFSGKNLLGLNNRATDFSSYEGSLSFFVSSRQESRLVLAGRVGGGINSGSYPFYQSQILDGKTMLRGYRKTRFYGDSKVYGNLEARLKLASFRSYLFPASFGVLGFYDVGRIWYKKDHESNRWHKGWGGGIWFTPFNLTVLSVEAGHSREGTLGYIRLGFLF